MKIAINAFSARVGGGKTYLVNLLRHLPDEDVEIFLFAHDDLSVPRDPRIVRLNTRWPTTNPFLRIFWEKFIFPLVLKRLHVEVLFCPGGIVNTRVPRGCAVVTMFRNMLPFDAAALELASSWKLKLKNFLLRRAMLSSMKHADLVIFISDYARHVIEKQIVLKNAVTIPHGISEHFCVADKQLARPDLPSRKKYILYVSRFEFYKRHLEVVKAYECLPDELKEEYVLFFAGGDDLPAAEDVRRYVDVHGLNTHVFFLGDYPYGQLPALYRHADLFVFASACENCPNILLEAMGAGAPIVCSDDDPMPEFGGDAVLYASPEDSCELSRQIGHLLSDPGLGADYSARSTDQVKRYRWQHASQRTWASIFAVRADAKNG